MSLGLIVSPASSDAEEGTRTCGRLLGDGRPGETSVGTAGVWKDTTLQLPKWMTSPLVKGTGVPGERSWLLMLWGN